MKRFLLTCGALAAVALSAPASAAEVTFGNPGTASIGDCTPGCTPRIQTLYSSTAFSGAGYINSLSLYLNHFAQTGQVFTIKLSTVSTAIGGLSATFANNVGANEALFFSGQVPVSGSDLKTTFAGTPFYYDPSAGNLLVAISAPNGSAIYSAYTGNANAQRVYSFNVGAPTGHVNGPGYVFVTTFDIGRGAAPVPEPATWALMIGGFGLAGAAMRRRVRTSVTFA